MMELHSSLSDDSTTTSQTEGELSVILTEYELQHQKLEGSIDNVNQSLTLYLALVALLGPLAAIAVVAWSPTNRVVSLSIAFLALVIALATVFTLFRSYQARILQTEAERALSRLRHYLVARHPEVGLYLAGPTYDDWPTPYTDRWSSLSFGGWIALILGAGFFAALSVTGFMFAIDFAPVRDFWWVPAVVVGAVVSWLCYRWLDRKLTRRAAKDQPLFPRETGISGQKGK